MGFYCQDRCHARLGRIEEGSLLLKHDLFRKPVATPGQARGRAFSGSCSRRSRLCCSSCTPRQEGHPADAGKILSRSPHTSRRSRKARRRRGDGGYAVADDGETSVGSIFVIDAKDRAAVDGFVRSDPYHVNRVWETVQIHGYNEARHAITSVRI
jgi:hypothetical protein